MLTPTESWLEYAPKAERYGRLISLWEIMRAFQTADFLFFVEVVTSFAESVKDAARVSYRYDLFENVAFADKWRFGLTKLESYCNEIDLDACVATIQQMLRELNKVPISHEKMSALSADLLSRLVDQTSQRYFYSLNLLETDYYNHPRKGWEAITERFGDIGGDVEEARKCFALSRYAAAVFHSLQVVETGLIELGTFIRVTDPKSGWTAVTRRLDQILKTDYKQLSDFERHNRDFLEQVQGTTEALKNAWRNKVSHAQGRLVLLTPDFTPDIAEEILFATRAFMRRLAGGLPKKT